MKEYINILAIGDSLINAKADNLGGWSKRFSEMLSLKVQKELNYYNEGIGGETSIGLLQRIDSSLKKENYWDLVIVGIGVNDSKINGIPPINNEVNPDSFKKNIISIYSILNDSQRVKQVLVSGIVPIIEKKLQSFNLEKCYNEENCKKYDLILREGLSNYENIYFLDFYNLMKKIGYTSQNDYMSDGLHPNSTGHKFLAEFAYEMFIEKILHTW